MSASLNNLITHKTYTFHTIPIQVVFEEGIIRITNNAYLWMLFDEDIIGRTVLLVHAIKRDYHAYYGKPLAIKDKSLGLEIWGHLYYEVFILSVCKLLRLNKYARRVKNLLKSAQIIDCGERNKDSNRRLWDILAPIHNFIGRFFPLHISKKKLKNH